MSAGAGRRATFIDGDVRVTSARLTGFVVNELVFPAAHTMQLDARRRRSRGPAY